MDPRATIGNQGDLASKLAALRAFIEAEGPDYARGQSEQERTRLAREIAWSLLSLQHLERQLEACDYL